MKIRALIIAPVILLVAGCYTRVDSDGQTVFVHAFDRSEAPVVTVLNGYRYSRRSWLVFQDEVWLLKLRGAGVGSLLLEKWPDLSETPAPPTPMQAGTNNPWFMPPSERYRYWVSPSDEGLIVAQDGATLDIYVKYID